MSDVDDLYFIYNYCVEILEPHTLSLFHGHTINGEETTTTETLNFISEDTEDDNHTGDVEILVRSKNTIACIVANFLEK